ncbi:hypothetical protein GQ43DRAFT_259429 [Delitschia confertaspora ATCC 74209]|uniref:Uncharacterized protein n=1 Tax=Delitschia confertaspora ATCC 74209 TaxID=1513339 RepID=A0A9P4JDP2_9PLEO|nr:hypothetical protein GQ43DRAFT_259429 [Delitschia confertaspora ATCC 74209]
MRRRAWTSRNLHASPRCNWLVQGRCQTDSSGSRRSISTPRGGLAGLGGRRQDLRSKPQPCRSLLCAAGTPLTTNSNSTRSSWEPWESWESWVRLKRLVNDIPNVKLSRASSL